VGTNSKYYTFDDRGNAVQRLDGAGAVVQSYLIGGHNAEAGSPASTDPYSGYGGQHGYYRDSESGGILCTYRFYDPEEGRWLNRDPIGYEGGVNLLLGYRLRWFKVLWALPLLMIFWVNLHGSFEQGLALILFTLIGEGVRRWHSTKQGVDDNEALTCIDMGRMAPVGDVRSISGCGHFVKSTRT
jgi:RHS repeat-associated protein